MVKGSSRVNRTAMEILEINKIFRGYLVVAFFALCYRRQRKEDC
jgi:hypothetical protein